MLGIGFMQTIHYISLFEREVNPLCIIKFVLYIMHRQYTTYIKQDAKLQLGYTWLHVSAVTGHLQAN